MWEGSFNRGTTVYGVYILEKHSDNGYCSSIAGPSPPSDVRAVQDGLTSIRVTWTPPSPLGNTTGYRIYYTGEGGSSGSVDVDGGNTNSHTLTGLTNGVTYAILIMARSSSASGLLSSAVTAGVVELGAYSGCLPFYSPSSTLHTSQHSSLFQVA